ncbi:MAG TPA: FAD-dependent oxidoreductase [Ktedonobacteraceae bacterium]|jgi:3-phenylpropionate/trans-cinnamate dioxygenase ferredoxin reductase subunit|nr:FAD-dependent oxidoreductase [Ktedonobacteraceae bacterium]
MIHKDVRFDGRVVIVGASLAGLRAAETLREEGFTGPLTLIGDEPYPPYDRPPLSKSVLTGWLPATNIFLPQMHDINATWLLGQPATQLDLTQKTVVLADGQLIPFDRLLITTGTRARQWPDATQAALDGVFTIRTLDDGARLRQRLAAGPKHVLVIGAGFTGSEVASVCRELGLVVTVTERSAAPLAGALGGAAGMIAAHLQRASGVDLRCNVTVLSIEGDAQGRLCLARLSDGDALEVDVAVMALGAVRNIEWLQSSGLAADARGVVCDASCRVFDADGIVTDDIFVAGDVARWPHPLFDGQLLAVEHWGNAVAQATIAAHNMVCAPTERRAHRHIPNFWSNQFGLNIKSVGLPTFADEVVVTQGSVSARRFVAAYGHKGRMVAALAVNMPRGLDVYEMLIAQKSPFPPALNAPDGPTPLHVVSSGFPTQEQPTHSPVATTTGPGPNTPPEEHTAAYVRASDPRVPPGPAPL